MAVIKIVSAKEALLRTLKVCEQQEDSEREYIHLAIETAIEAGKTITYVEKIKYQPTRELLIGLGYGLKDVGDETSITW